jgi:hypothetical protein
VEIIALDIETDTSPCHNPILECCERRGLDPSLTPITVVSLQLRDGNRIYRSSEKGEKAALEALDYDLRSLTGILVTWNGSVFDMPFLAERYKYFEIENGLVLHPDPVIEVKYKPLPGHNGGYRVSWYQLDHADIAFAYKEEAERIRVPWSLKQIAVAHGLAPIEVERKQMHNMSPSELDNYVASDTRVTYELAILIKDINKYRDGLRNGF